MRMDLQADRATAADPTAKQLRSLEIFSHAGALLEGHFTYTSGLHGNRYLEKFRVLERAEYAEPLCRMIAGTFAAAEIDVVAGPTTGGIILAYEVGRLLRVPGIFCERGESGRVFRRGFRIEPGQRVLVVDDIVTTGGSLADTFRAVETAGGVVAGVGVMADRTGGRLQVPYPYFACLEVEFQTWSAAECPMCARGDAAEEHRGATRLADPPV